jgi:molybdopterin synthase catalytic subunit
MTMIKIVSQIHLEEAYAYLNSPEAGAVNLFIGTVRNNAHGKLVEKLVFEAYEPMALKEMEKLAAMARQKWTVSKLLMLHVVGEKAVGEPVVVIGIASPHRQEAFEATRFLIDELKKTVPIWKKEFYRDGSIWVNAHP